MKKKLMLASCLFAGIVGLGQAQASTTLSFSCIAATGTASSCAVANQLSVVVSDSGANLVSFKFQNNVGVQSSITEIYFDAGNSSLSSGWTGMGDSGDNVAFSYQANPSVLPGGNTISPEFAVSNVAIFTADADAGRGGAVVHGINASGEWLTMSYALNSGMSYANVLSDLATGKLRIGMHVTGFDQMALGVPSTSYVNNHLQLEPLQPVPVPAAAWLLGSGLIGMVGVARRKQAPKSV